MRDHFIKRLTELAAKNPKILLITGDLGFGVFEEFARRFPKQYLNAGVAEQNMSGLAAGLALEGRTVFTYSIGNFPTLRCLEQIRNDICYHQADVKIVSIGGGFSYGALGFSHHATEDLSILRALPEMTVVAPGDDWEAEEATEALARQEGPGYLRLDKSSAGHTARTGETFEIGRGRVLLEGDDFTLVSTGGILGVVLEAAKKLVHEGIKCRVISLHTLKPLDTEILLKSARETGGIMTVEENTVTGGLGGAVAEACLEGGVPPALFYRIGLRDSFATIVGSQSHLRRCYAMDEQTIVKKAIQFLGFKRKISKKGAAL
ncbi:MAG: transketolase [Deltaproteobacteria bacterium]|nr:transketolase [Deltaproteobacteria bacterium]